MREPARAGLRAAVHDLLRTDLGATEVGRLCPRCGSGAHGVPWVRLADGAAPRVSVSYTDGLAAVAWSHHGPVGVDVERTGPPVDGYGDRASWTRTEALLKATGEGLARDPRDPGVVPDLPVQALALPPGFVGHLAGGPAVVRLLGPTAGPAGRSSPATR